MAKLLDIKPKVKGLAVYTHAPTAYSRKEGGKFILDDNLPQRDRYYLRDVMSLDYFIEVAPKPKTKKKEDDKE